MRSNIINTEHLDNREYVLMSNNRTELDIIPSEYVLEYTSKLDDVSTLKIEVPRYIMRGEQKIEYPLYNKLHGKQFIVVRKDGVNLERFIIDAITEEITAENSKKTFTANSYENILKNRACMINEGMTRQLYKKPDETFDVADGILNIFEQQTGWTVDYENSDSSAFYETVEENIIKEINVDGGTKVWQKVFKNDVLIDADITVPSEDGFALNFDIVWNNIVVTDSNGNPFKADSIIHTFTDLYTGVKHIKITYTSDIVERYGITYDLTLDDDNHITQTYAFVNCKELQLQVEGIRLNYITSQTQERNMAKYRFLEHQSTYWYQFLKTTVQEAYNCYIFFDSFNKSITVRDKSSYSLAWKGFYLDFNNLLTKITKTPKVEDIATRLWIESNNVDITEVNPLGTSYLEDYSYFRNNGSMSSELCNALDRYYARLNGLQASWVALKNEKNSVDQQSVKKNSLLISLNSQLKTQNSLLTAYIKGKDEKKQEQVAKEIASLEAQIASTTLAIQDLEEQSATLLERMQEIGRQMSKENATDGQGKIFTYTQNGQQINLLDELEDFTIEQTYKDDVHTKANRLYTYAQELMKEKARLSYSFSLEHNDLVRGIKHPLGWQWFIELGAKVELNDKDIADADGFVTIYAYTYSPKENKISNVDFNNNTKVIEAVKGISAIGKLVHQTASMTDFWKSTWRDSVQNNIVVSDIRKNGLDVAANTIRGGSTVNKVSMTEAGLFVIDANNENNQIYIGASLIAVTDDKWVHAKTAIDKGGVIADTIVGRLILGENLWISNEDGSFNIEPNGLTIYDENHVERVQMGLNSENKPYFHLGRENDGNFLIFDENGQLNIQASAFKIKVGGTAENPTYDTVIGQGQASTIIKNEIGQVIIPTRNYALDSLRGYTIVGDANGDKVFKLCDLSQNQEVFNGKKTAISFSWEYVDGTATSSFYIRTGGNHNQKLTETFTISPSLYRGKYNTVNTITVDVEVFDTLELVANNLHGKIIISLLKFEINDNMTTWTQAPEDGQEAYTILLSNETQIISVNKNLYPLADETFETDVLVYQGAVQQNNFTIENLQSVGDIKATVTGHKISYSVKRDTSLTELKGRFDFTIKVDGQEFKKSWAWVAVKQVTDGYIMVTGDQVFKYSNNFDGEPSPSTLTLNVKRFDLDTVGKWQYRNSNNEWVDWLDGEQVVTSDTLTIRPNDKMYADNDVKTMQVRYIVNAVYDEFTTYKVSDGANGSGTSSILHIRYSANSDGSNMTVQPQPDSKYIGTYIATTSVASDNPSDYTWVLIKGQDGIPGTDGTDGTSSYFHVKYSNDGETFTENNGETVGKWIGTYVDYNELDSDVFSDYDWVKYVGEDGIDGSNAEYVKLSGEQVFKYTGGFNTIPTPSSITISSTVYNFTDPSYEWSYKRSGDANWTILEGQTTSNFVLNHNNSEIFTAMAVTNVTIRCRVYTAYDEAFDEITIAKIRDGVDGVSIIQIQEQYYLSTSQQELMNGEWVDDVAPSWEKGKYIWTRTEFTYSDGTTKTTNAICVTGRDGNDGLNGGVSVSKVDVYYYQSDSSSQLINGKWQTNAPVWTNGKYVWTKTITYLDSGTQYESKPVCISGEKGQDGIDGTNGKDGVSNYFFIRYSEFEDGHDMTELPTSKTKYMGTATSTVNEAPTEYTSYKWTLVKGTDGKNGTDGTPGVDGSSSYLHIKYSNDGVTFTNNNGEELGKWIGTYVDTNSTDSSNFADYNWVRFVGEDGINAKYVIVTGDQTFKYADNYTTLIEPQEIVLTAVRYNITQQGKWQYKEVNGAWTDLGATTEQLIVTPNMASFANGAKTLSLRYIADSCYDIMTIAKVSDGYNGTDGKDGINGVNNYFHIRYSANATGADMTSMPNDSSKYMGTCVTDTNEAPTDYRLYSWSLFRGNDGTDGTTIVNIKEQYYLSTSQTMLTNGEWQDSAPTWESGKYIWTRTVFSYNNSTTSTTEPICVTGRDGADGMNGGVSVSGVDTYYYQSTSATELTGGEWKTVSPVWQNGKYVWSKTVTYLDNGTQYESKPICLTGQKGNDGTDGVPGKDGEDGKTTYLHIKYSNDGETFTENNGETIGTWIGTYVDFIKADSTNFNDYEWKKYTGEDGRDGYDAYTALLTNENHTFPCDFEGNISSDITITTTAIGYKGTTQVTPTIGTIPSVTGMTITKDKNVITITAKTGKTLSDNGSIQIPIIIDGKTFNRAFSWTKSKNGKNGIDGIDGINNYFFIRYSANADGSGMTTEPQSNTMYMGTCSTNSETAPTDYKSYKWTLVRGVDGKDGEKGAQGSAGADGKTSYLHIKYSNDGTTFSPNNGEEVGLWIGTYVDFTEADSNTFSKYTWKKYVGKDGQDGTDGEDAYTVILTNENHAFPTDANGKITAEVSTTTQVIAYKGTTPITPTIGTLPTVKGLTLSKSGTTITIKASVGTSMAESGSINIPITVDGKSFTKVFSYSKARQGADGKTAKLVTVSGEQVFKYSNNFTGTPTPERIILKATVSNTTETGKWQYMDLDGVWQDYTKSGNLVTTKTIDILHNSRIFGTSDAKSMRLRYYISDSLYDEITLVKVSDGAKGTDGKNGIDGVNSYFYIRYSDNPTGSGMTELPNENSKYLGTCSTTSPVAPSSHTEYKWSLIKGTDGADGTTIVNIREQYYLSTSQQTLINGEWLDSAPVWTSGKYIWTRTVFSYNNNTETTTNPICVTGKDGADGLNGGVSVENVDVFYYQSTSPIQLTGGSWQTNAPVWTNGKYVWTKTITYLDNGNSHESQPVCITGEKGQDGSDGIQGEKGEDGRTSYLHIKYSDDGKTFTSNNGETIGKWIGTYVDFNEKDSTNFKDYTWKKYVGEDGTDGIDGIPGKDGTSSYFYVRYSTNSNGNPMTTTPNTNTKYIGVCSTTSSTAPSSYSSYTWSKFIGEDGYVGRDGVDGTSSYLHIKYSNDGGKTFTSNKGEDLGSYIGTYVDTNSADSNNVKDYKWSKFVGTDGKNGIDGINGKDGVSTYFYVRYSANANGSGMTSTPSSSSLYIGVCSTTSATAPTNASSYQWTLIKGSDGKDGTPGAKGDNGQTSYLHIKYSNDGKTFTSNNGEDLGKWIGTYVDFNKADSTSFGSYTWSKYVGENGQDGTDGTDGTDAYTIILTNEAQTIPTNSSRVPLSSATYSTDIVVYQGTTKRTDFALGTIKSANGITVAKPSNSKVNFTVSTGTALSADNGTFTVPITIDNKTFNKVFSWSCSKQGNKGDKGDTGAAGADAMAVSVTGEQVFKYANNFTGTPTPETIPLTVTRINTTASGKWQYMDEKSAWQDFTKGETVQTGNTLDVSYNSKIFGTTSAKSMRVRYYISNTVYDEITLVKVSDGAKGSNGKDSYTVVLTNENHSFLAGSNGNISTETSTTTKVYAYKGATPVAFTLGTIAAPTGMTITDNLATGGRTITFTVATGTSLANSGTIDIPVIVDGTTYTKTFSWSKALKGTNGNAGKDAYTVILTNENHTFNAGQSGNIASAISTSTKVIAYKGATSVTPTIGTLPSVTGLTLSKASDGVTINIQANTGTSLAANGKFDIPITVDGKSFTKSFSWTKVNKGTNAYSVSIAPTSQVFKSMDGGKTFTPDTIKLAPVLQNLTFSKWQYSTDGGTNFTDVTSGSNGLTVGSSNKLAISKSSSLFTDSVSSITFKLVTNNSSYYDTMTIVKLNDIGELQLGGKNLLKDSKKMVNGWTNEGSFTVSTTADTTYNKVTKTISGATSYGWYKYTSPKIDVANIGKQTDSLIISFEMQVANLTNWEDAMVIVYDLFDSSKTRIGKKDVYIADCDEQPSLENGKWSRVIYKRPDLSKTKITYNDGKSSSDVKFIGFSFILPRNGSVSFRKPKVEIGNIATDYSPAPEDSIDYTDKALDDLRNIDLQDIINLNNQAVSKIDSIIQDGKITPNEKVDLQAEFARIKVMRDSTRDFYDTVNDTTLSTLLNDMETTYQNVKTLITPVISNMTKTSNASASEIRRAFIAFYEINQSLLTALQQSVAIISINNSTTIEALDYQISFTAAKQTIYNDKMDEVASHLDFTQEGFVQIYATTNGVKGRFETQITDQKLAFKDNGEEVAYISNQEMYITKATITDQMQIGDFIIKPSGTTKGGIMFIHIDNA